MVGYIERGTWAEGVWKYGVGENMVLGGISGPKSDEVRGEWRRLTT